MTWRSNGWSLIISSVLYTLCLTRECMFVWSVAVSVLVSLPFASWLFSSENLGVGEHVGPPRVSGGLGALLHASSLLLLFLGPCLFELYPSGLVAVVVDLTRASHLTLLLFSLLLFDGPSCVSALAELLSTLWFCLVARSCAAKTAP